MTFKSNQSKSLAIILAIAVIVSVLWDFIDLPDASNRIEQLLIPPSTTHLTVRSLDHTPTEIDILGNALAVKNIYQIGNQQFLVFVLDGTTNRQAVHDPMHCFHSGGWTLEESTHLPMAKGVATELKIIQPNRETEVLFWYSDGKRQHLSPFTYWVRSTLRRLTLGYSGEEQVLIVVQKLSPSESTYWSTLFDIVPNLNKI